MDEPVLTEIAGKYGKSVAQIMIRWQLQQNVVVIPKSANAARIKENAAVFDFEISADDMARISGLDREEYTISWRPEEGWV